MEIIMRKAEAGDKERIWEIIKDGILKRKEEGSTQWQEGYPNEGSVSDDVDSGEGIVCIVDGVLEGYMFLTYGGEAAYDDIKGEWSEEGKYSVVHRMSVSRNMVGKRIGDAMMEYAEQESEKKECVSIRVDTNWDNASVLKLMARRGYRYCGKIYYKGGERLAFDKVFRVIE